MNAPSPGLVRMLVAVLCVVWSSTWWAIRQGLEELPPLRSAAARFLIAGAVMSIAFARLAHREGGTPPPRWLWATMGVCNFALSYGILYWTETRVPSGIAAVLWAVFPILMATSGRLWLGERIRGRQACGFVLGAIGTAVMFAGDLGGDRAAVLPFALLLLLSPVVSAVGTTLVKRHGGGHSSLLLNRNAMLLGGVLLALAAAVFERDEPMHLGPRGIVATLYLALVGTCVTFGIYFWLLRSAQASRLSLISYVTPCLALAFAWLVGDGELDGRTLLGCACVALGIGLVVAPPRRRPAPDPVRGS